MSTQFETFEYLDGYSLCSIFYGMNQRLNDLLRLCKLRTEFNKHKRDKKIWHTLATVINPEQSHILSIDSVIIPEQCLSFIGRNLVSLYIYQMNETTTDRILKHLPLDNQLRTLYIEKKENCCISRGNSYTRCVFFNHGHKFTSLVNLSLANYRILLKLRRLTLTKYIWGPNFVQFLQKNVPNLQSLYFYPIHISPNELNPCIIKNIQELDINARYNFKYLQNILSILRNLKRLRICWEDTSSINSINGTQRRELIEKYFPRLKHLTLEFPNGIDEDLAETFYTKELCPTKTVVMKMMVNKAESRYRQVKTIYFNHQWHFKYFDYCKNKNQNDNDTLQSRSSSSSRTPPRSTSKHQLQLQKKMRLRSHS
ncbi:unnamed protein product [Adineta steineri]|uniref:Uncharacterized protein n=1 Tax=Adineta steineri TaxID=433720 RepID=A0A815HN89_9BILA|nr:unnamed protein product [Adineta steineri]CAF3976772.1 unnamed protein product [Adineta steineri]